MGLTVSITQTGGPPLPDGTALSITVTAEPDAPVVVPVLEPADFTYLGFGFLPADDPVAGTRFGYSTGALSGRVVDGDDGTKKIRLFITQAQAETGWPDPVAEVEWAGVGNRMTLVQNLGDITQGRRVSTAGNPCPIRGLLWDPESQRLIWTYMDQYNVVSAADPCLGSTQLEPEVVAAGPWRLSDISQRTGGYLAAIPARLRPAFQGHAFTAGAPLGSGDAGSAFGVFCAAFTLPDPATPPDAPGDGHVTIPDLTLIYSDIDHRQARDPDVDECSWDHYGESNAQGNQPQWNPVQDGRGCTVDGDLCGTQKGPCAVFNHMDSIDASVWIDGPHKQGLVYISQLTRTIAACMDEYGEHGRCQAWYGPAQDYGVSKLSPFGHNDVRYGATSTGPGCTTMQGGLMIYDSEALRAVAAGASPIGVVPTTDAVDLGALATEGAPFPSLATVMHQFGGAWWEPQSQTVFISAAHAEWQGEWRPVVHAIHVAC